MLLNSGRHRYDTTSARDSVHNYYEQMVIDQIIHSNIRAQTDPEFMADVACVALNRLPPRYVRHDVDMTFFLSPIELDEMVNRVNEAVEGATNYVISREHKAQEPELDKPQEKPQSSKGKTKKTNRAKS